MDNLKILTPTQLWAGYDPEELPLDISYIGIESREKVTEKKLYFTVDELADGKIRAFMRIVYPAGVNKRLPTVVFLPSVSTLQVSDSFIEEIVGAGYIFATVDYSGYAEGKENHTVYPKSAAECECEKDGYRLCSVKDGDMHHACWFSWTKIVRRAVTLLCSDFSVDKDRIALIGVKDGAQLVWETAGVDNRICAIVPILGCGYNYHKEPRYSDKPEKEMPAELVAFVAALASQSYAKMVTCPVLYEGTTNSEYADVDRIKEILDLAPSENKLMAITARATESIDDVNFKSIIAWLGKIFAGEEITEKAPEIKAYVSEGVMYCSVTAEAKPRSVTVYTAFDQDVPELRNWNEGRSPVMSGEGEYFIDISVPEGTKKVFIFANALYESGILCSTDIKCFDPVKEGVTKFAPVRKNKTRIIFSGSQDSGAFAVENDLFAVAANNLYIKEGPCGIKGIGSTAGWLSTYKLGENKFAGEDGYILQMDVFTSRECSITFSMSTFADDKFRAYSAVRKFPASKRWQRVNFSVADFKDEERVSLKSWKIVRRFEIKDAADVLFNNVLWV